MANSDCLTIGIAVVVICDHKSISLNEIILIENPQFSMIIKSGDSMLRNMGLIGCQIPLRLLRAERGETITTGFVLGLGSLRSQVRIKGPLFTFITLIGIIVANPLA